MKSRRRFAPALDALESRQLLSWTPATIPYNVIPPSGGNAIVNAWNGVGSIQNGAGKYVYWPIFTEHSGNYTFTVTATPTVFQTMNGPITEYTSPIYALYNSHGQEMWWTDNPGQISKTVVMPMTGGQHYELAVSNLNGYIYGNVKATITGGSYVTNVHHTGGGTTSGGEAYLNGNTLEMWLYAFNDNSPRHTDTFTCYFETASNQVIGWEQVSCWTQWNGSYSNTTPIDISGWNLSGFDHFYLTLN